MLQPAEHRPRRHREWCAAALACVVLALAGCTAAPAYQGAQSDHYDGHEQGWSSILGKLAGHLGRTREETP